MLVAALVCLTSAAPTAVAQPVPPGAIGDLGGVTPGWAAVEPGGATGCATDETPYRFFVHEGPDPTRLLVWFQGGGACWHTESCAAMYDRTVVDRELDPYAGIFDFADADNPFASYSVVFIPYCTGDVHIGDATVTYDGGPTVRHLGWTNVDAVLSWLRARDGASEAAEHLVVAGASAGSYGAIFHAPSVAALYPEADLVVIGDSGLPLLHGSAEILARWGATARLRDLWGTDPGAAGDASDAPVTIEAAHVRIARLHPDARIAQVMSDRDRTQAAFHQVSGSSEWREEAYRILDVLEREVPSFHAFVIEGLEHGLLRDEFFDDRTADGTSLSTWISDLVEGRPVSSVYCAACTAAG